MTARAAGLRVWVLRYAGLIRAAWLVDLQYRAALLIWLIWGVAEPVISLGIWWSIAGDGAVQGYDRAGFARYFFAVMLVNQLTLAWDAWNIDAWIRGGEMNHRLARPLAPVHEALADNIAYKLQTAGLIVAAWAAIAIVWPAVRLPVDPARWGLAALAILLAAGIRFLNSFATGLLGFWTTRATALMEFQFGVSLFLSGRVAPLALLPSAVGAFSSVLWFPYMIAFPAEVLTGTMPTGPGMLRGFAFQLVWLLAWFGLYQLVWRRGVRRYGAVGG